MKESEADIYLHDYDLRDFFLKMTVGSPSTSLPSLLNHSPLCPYASAPYFR